MRSGGGLTVTRKVQFSRRAGARRRREAGPAPVPGPVAEATLEGRVPRVSRLMALALRFDDYLKAGAVADQADLARLGHVTRARVTQIMNLLHLAPDIQEELLFLPRVAAGPDPIAERHLRPLAAELDWDRQRLLWQALRRRYPG